MAYRIAFLASLLCLAGLPLRAETLKGKVVDRGSLSSSPGKGVAGVKLTLWDASGKRLAVKVTGKNGAYAFPRLKAGKYTLSAERAGWLPAPAVRTFNLLADTAARYLYLDKNPTAKGVPVRGLVKKKKHTLPGYYPDLAEGIISPHRQPALFRDAWDPISIGRFFDATDTTEAWRRLWITLAWTEIETQSRPIATRIYLAHALDSILRESGWPVPTGLKVYLKVPADSMEALSKAVRTLILAPSKKSSPADIAQFKVPKTMALEVFQEAWDSPGIPLARKKAFLKRAGKPDALKVFPAEMLRRLTADLPKPAAKGRKKKAPPPPPPVMPTIDSEALWKIVLELAAGKKPNPVAVFHLGRRRLEQGHAREAIADLQRAAQLRPDYAPAIAAEAQARIILGELPMAEKRFEALTQLDDPDWQARGYHGLGFLQWKSGRTEEAERSLTRSIGFDSKSDSSRKALYLLAGISLVRGSWESVEALLDTVAARRPREAEAHYWLGRMALKRKQDGVAEFRFRQAASLSPGRIEYVEAMASLAFAREDCELALKMLRPNRARLGGEGLTVYGECLLQGNKPKEAALEFEKLYEAHPSSFSLSQWAKALVAAGQSARAITMLESSPHARAPEVQKTLAQAHIEAGAPGPARSIIETLLSAKADEAELHYLLGRCFFLQRDYGAASRAFTDALRFKEDYPDAIYQKGLCLLKAGSSGEAHHYFQELSDSQRKLWKARGFLGRGQAFAQENKLEAAEENLSRSFRESPTAEAAAHLALVLLRMNRPSEAEGWAAKAREADPDHPLATMATVDVLLEQKRDSEALHLAAQGHASHPASCEFALVAAKASLRAGRDAEAKDLSIQAKTLCPSEPTPHFYLGSLSARSGTSNEARQHFEEYVRAGGDAKRVPQAYR